MGSGLSKSDLGRQGPLGKVESYRMVRECATQCTNRNSDIDTIKGMLVFLMLAYHCASMGKNTYPELRAVTHVIDPIHYAFILISGYICGWHYLPRSRISLKTTRRRLRVRAGKIMAIFMTVNLILYVTGIIYSYEMLKNSVNSFDAVMQNLVLSMSGKLAAAEILFYIALFLLVASLLVGRVTLPLILVLFIGMSSARYFSLTAVFVAFGLAGMFLGILSDTGCLTKIWQRMKEHKWFWLMLLTAYFCSLPMARWVAGLQPLFKK